MAIFNSYLKLPEGKKWDSMLQSFQPRFRGSRLPALRFRNPVSGAFYTTHHSQTRGHPGAIPRQSEVLFCEAFVLDSWAYSVPVHICIFVHPKVDRISKKSFIFPLFYVKMFEKKNIFYLLQDDCIHLSCHGDLLSPWILAQFQCWLVIIWWMPALVMIIHHESRQAVESTSSNYEQNAITL